eukprot:scaffold43837_cov33-Phaeocystis_antarctica.AAC.1
MASQQRTILMPPPHPSPSLHLILAPASASPVSNPSQSPNPNPNPNPSLDPDPTLAPAADHPDARPPLHLARSHVLLVQRLTLTHP